MKSNNAVSAVGKILLVVVSIMLVSACNSYKKKIGTKDDAHLQLTEAESLLVPKNDDVKLYDTTYDIPNISNASNVESKDLAVPPGFE